MLFICVCYSVRSCLFLFYFHCYRTRLGNYKMSALFFLKKAQTEQQHDTFKHYVSVILTSPLYLK